MTKRRWFILGALLLILTVGAELYVRPWSPSRACIQIGNQGDTAMEDLVVAHGDTKIKVGRLGVGETTNVWCSIAEKGPVTLQFKQTGNPMTGFQIPDFDPGDNVHNGFKLVLFIKNDQIERFMEDDFSRTPIKSLWDNVRDWFGADIPMLR